MSKEIRYVARIYVGEWDWTGLGDELSEDGPYYKYFYAKNLNDAIDTAFHWGVLDDFISDYDPDIELRENLGFCLAHLDVKRIGKKYRWHKVYDHKWDEQ